MITHDGIAVAYFSCLVLSLIISSAVLIFLGRRTSSPGAVSIRWMMGCVIIWLFGALLEIASDRYTIQLAALNIQYVGKSFAPYAWFVFALKYYGYDEKLTRKVLFLLGIIPLITIIAGYTNDVHHLMWTSVSQQNIGLLTVLTKEYGIWSWVSTPYNYLLIIAGTFIIGLRLAGDPRLYRGQGASLLAAITIPLALNVMYYLGIPREGIDLTPCAFSISGLTIALAFFRLHLLDIRPVAYNTIIENMNSAVIVLDTTGRVTWLNKAAESILRLSLNQAIGKQIDSLPGFNQEILRFIRNPEDAASDIIIEQGETRQIYGPRITQLYDRSHHPVGQLVLLDDITGRRTVEIRNRELEEQVNQTSRLAAAGEVAADIAHEINNPLTSIISFSDWLINHDTPEHIKKDVEIIYSAAKQAAEVTSRLLNFTGHFDSSQESVNINQIIEATIQLRYHALTNTNITVIRQFDDRLPETVASFGQLQEVFLNLILNAESAIKDYRRKGTITITTERRGNLIHIAFKDDGPGIPEANIDKIFQHFFTTKAPGKGTGLGLNICRRIIQQYGGTIYAESEYGQGAAFIIDLPIRNIGSRELPDERIPEESAGYNEAGAAANEKVRVIIVDDEPLILYILEQLLTEEGYEVVKFVDAVEGLEAMKTGNFTLALVDVRMPGMSGITLYNRLKEALPEAAGRLVFITGDSISLDTSEFLSSAAVRYVTKPFEPAKLRAYIRKTLSELRTKKDG